MSTGRLMQALGEYGVPLGLAVAAILSIAVRLMPMRYGFYLNEFDPYFHYYATSVMVEDLEAHGSAGIQEFLHTVDRMAWYPWGYDLGALRVNGLYLFNAALYLALRAVGLHITLYQYAALAPVAMGGLAVFPVFMIVRRATGNPYAALLGSFLIAVLPGLMLRTDFGWYKGTPFAYVLGTFSLALLLIGVEDSGWRSYAYSLAAGVLLGYVQAMWGGAVNFAGVAGAALLLAPFAMRVDKDLPLKEVLFVVPTLIPAAFPSPGLSWAKYPTELLLYGAVVIGAISALVARGGFVPGRAKLGMAALIVATVAAFLYRTPHALSGRYLSVLNPLMRIGPSPLNTVAEQQSVSGISVLATYGVLVLLAIAAGYYMLGGGRGRRRFSSVLVPIFILWSMYVATSFAQLLPFLSIALAVGAPIGLHYAVSGISPGPAVLGRARRGKARLDYYKYGRAALVLAVVAMTAYPAYAQWVPSNNAPVTILTSATTMGYNPAWLNALSWINSSTPANSVVIAWWDYGYWIEVVGNRTTVVDNATINSTQISLVAQMFLDNETQAIKILNYFKSFDPSRPIYIAVFATGADPSRLYNDPYLSGYQVSGRIYGLGGDEGKVDAMIVWAGYDRSLYINSTTGMFTDYFYNDTLIGQMLPLRWVGWAQIDPVTGQLVGISPYYVQQPDYPYYQLPFYTYGLVYNSTSYPIRLAYSTPIYETPNGLWAQVLIYQYVG
ncbi:MAG: STT3 domain-containing protein [Nitrososphaeria archaeon]